MTLILIALAYLAIGYSFTIMARVIQKKNGHDKEDVFDNMIFVFGWPFVILLFIVLKIMDAFTFILTSFSNLIEMISDKIVGK